MWWVRAAVLVGTAFVVYDYLAPVVEAELAQPPDSWQPPSDDRAEPDAVVDLMDRLHEARVSHGETICDRWTGNRWVCPGMSPWLWVGRYLGQVTTDRGPERRACIWAHPESRGGRPLPLTIDFPAIELAADLHGEAAILDVGRTGGPVELSVRVDGKQRARVHLTDNRGRRWSRWQVPTAGESGRRARVEVQVTAADPSWRQVCFTGFAGAPPGSGPAGQGAVGHGAVRQEKQR